MTRLPIAAATAALVLAASAATAERATLAGTARVLENTAGMPSFLDAAPLPSDVVSFALTIQLDEAGPDENPSANFGFYPLSMATGFQMDFSLAGSVELQGGSIFIAATEFGNPASEGWFYGVSQTFSGQDWQFNLTLRQQGSDFFSSDALAVDFDPAAFLTSGGPDDIVINNPSLGVSLTLLIETAAWVDPDFTAQPAQAVIASEGDPAIVLTAEASNVDAFQWLKDGQPITDGPLYSGAATNTLSITTRAEATGVYMLRASNALAAKDSDPAIVAVRPGPCPTDLTGDGVLDLSDVTAFITGFTAGCPD